jgi:hypothetical protein
MPRPPPRAAPALSFLCCVHSVVARRQVALKLLIVQASEACKKQYKRAL